MSKLEFRVLTQAAEIDLFLESFKLYVQVKLPESYVRNGKVIGAFVKNELIGGYLLITRGPFRAVVLLPDAVRREAKDLERGDLVEVNGLWIHERYRGSRESQLLWMQLRRDILASRASHLLLLYNARARGLAEFYEKTLHPRLLYQGAPTPNPIAQTSYEEVAIALVSRIDIRLSLYRGLALLAKRASAMRAA